MKFSLAVLCCALAGTWGNPLCANPERSLSKNQMYNPAFKYSVELGGECSMKQFVQGPVIGKGHYGTVKQAVHRATGTVVALKFLEGINPAKFTDHRNEECISHAVESPLLVKHYCTMMHDDKVVFVMEYLEGVSFRQYFQEKGKLSDAQLQYYVAQMMLGLEILHEKGIIFGSLTSANVMLLSDGRLKIIDFGASMRLRPGEEQDAKPTFVSYKARPHKWKNFAHDYYSLGILLFELAYANKTGKWMDPKQVAKVKCTKILDMKICDFIGRMFTVDYATIWGTTQRTRNLLKKHPWFTDIDWNWIDNFAKGNIESEQPATDAISAQQQSYYSDRLSHYGYVYESEEGLDDNSADYQTEESYEYYFY